MKDSAHALRARSKMPSWNHWWEGRDSSDSESKSEYDEEKGL